MNITKAATAIVLLALLTSIFLYSGFRDSSDSPFKARSDNWNASYVISKYGDDHYNVSWEFIYVGKNKPDNGAVHYEIMGNNVNINANVQLTGGTIKGSSTSSLYDLPESIRVIIEWDDHKEILLLQR